MKMVFSVFFSLLFLLTSIGFAGKLTSQQAVSKINHYLQTTSKTPLLYVLNAHKSHIQRIFPNENLYKIVLHGVSNQMTYFSNRPQRVAGTMPTEYFFKNWNKGKNSFAKDHPNFALNVQENNRQQSYVFELITPVYSAKTHTLAFIGKLLDHTKVPNTKNFTLTNLFIDFNWHNNVP